MPKSNPWSKFFWQDWEADPALRACSLASQGMWMRLLCVMAKAEPVGYLQIGGNPCTVETICRLVGEDKETVERLMNEIMQMGVSSTTRKGVIYSRRLVRDAKLSESRSKNGKLGAAVTNCKQREKSSLPQQTCRQKSGPISHKPEAIYQKTDIRRKSKIPYTAEFENFWKAYPTDGLMSKKEAFTQWKKLANGDRETAMLSIPDFKAYCTANPDYRPVHACRYLSQRRFDGFVDGKTDTMEELRRRLNA